MDTGFLLLAVIASFASFIAVWAYLELTTRIRVLTEENALLRLHLRRYTGAPR